MNGAKEAKLKRIDPSGGMPQLEFVCPHCSKTVKFSDPMRDSLVVAVRVDPCESAGGHRWMAVKKGQVTDGGR